MAASPIDLQDSRLECSKILDRRRARRAFCLGSLEAGNLLIYSVCLPGGRHCRTGGLNTRNLPSYTGHMHAYSNA